MTESEPLVSISCITYNHSKFIRKCLDGFLMQKTNFSFEILIHDDASTDGTQDIIREYQKSYPKIIKPIFQKENQYSKGVSISATFNWPRARGKYIAMCEGDDYWTDPLKLQKQVGFLEAHKAYSLCFNKTKVVYTDNNLISFVPNLNESSEYPIVALIKKNYIQTCSVVFRNILLDFPKGYNELPMGDWPLFLLLANKGKIFYMNDPMSVYNNHLNGVWNSKPNSERSLDRDKLYKFIIPKLSPNYKKIAKEARIQNYNLYLNQLIDEKNIKKALVSKLFHHPKVALKFTDWKRLKNEIFKVLRRKFI